MRRQMIVKIERARELLMQTESDIRWKIALKDRLPREPARSMDIGDEVTFRDHKEKKMRVGTITGFDGTLALIKWCNHERRVPARELMPLKERRELLEDGDTDIDSAEGYIEEIIPKRQDGPVRKKKVEIIPSLTSIQVERELRERRRLSDVLSEQSDHLPKYKVFTQSEGESEKEEPRKGNKPKGPPPPPPVSRESRPRTRDYTSKRYREERSPSPVTEEGIPVEIEYRPKRFREVRLKLKSGEVIEGKVSHVEKCSSNWFFVTNKDRKHIPIDIETVDEWLYLDE
jgi:hypothetical protein